MKLPRFLVVFALATYLPCCFASLVSGLGYSSSGDYIDRHIVVAGEGVFAKQIDDGSAYTLLDSSEPGDTPVGPSISVEPHRKFSGGGLIDYLFDSMTDIRFSFFINEHKKSDVVSAGVDQHLDPLLLPAGWKAEEAAAATSRYQYKTNIFNLLFGHWFITPYNMAVHPYLGINISDLASRQITP